MISFKDFCEALVRHPVNDRSDRRLAHPPAISVGHKKKPKSIRIRAKAKGDTTITKK